MLKLEDKYAEYKELNRNVIKKAVDEINELTDLSIDYRPIREGKRIVSIEFKVQCLNDEITQQIALEQISLDEV
jgi:plasmid replication initiation protein